jgi:hypothetical protein
MTSTDDSRAREIGQKIIARALKERRRFRRVQVSVTGRLYIPATQEEAICTVEDISPGDASLLCQLRQEPKGRAVIYLDTLGRFEGPIVRAKSGSFVMTFTCSVQKREKLADQLMIEMNRQLLDDADLRRYDRRANPLRSDRSLPFRRLAAHRPEGTHRRTYSDRPSSRPRRAPS